MKYQIPKIERPLKVNYKVLEVIGFLADASEDKTFSARFFRDRGLIEAVDTLVELGMIDERKDPQTPYSFNQRGRDYAAIMLMDACNLSNTGRTEVRYFRAKPLAPLAIDILEFSKSPVKIEPKI